MRHSYTSAPTAGNGQLAFRPLHRLTAAALISEVAGLLELRRNVSDVAIMKQAQNRILALTHERRRRGLLPGEAA